MRSTNSANVDLVDLDGPGLSLGAALKALGGPLPFTPLIPRRRENFKNLQEI